MSFWKRSKVVEPATKKESHSELAERLRKDGEERIAACQAEIDEWIKTQKKSVIVLTLKNGTTVTSQEFSPRGEVSKEYANYLGSRREISYFPWLRHCCANKYESKWVAEDYVSHYIHQKYFVVDGVYINNDEISRINIKEVP